MSRRAALPDRPIRPEPPVVELRGVSFAYNGAPVLEEVDLSIDSREWVCLVGPNGGGKTTLLKLILGLLEPTSGEVRLFGQTPDRGRLRVGYMPQHLRFDPQFPMTVMDIVLMGRLGGRGLGGLLGWYGADDRRVALEALAEVGMESQARRAFADLSGGQRQRVLVARALACRPELLLLDEPTASVDARGEAQLLEILVELNKRMTVVMVSHDLGFVLGMVRSVVCVNRRVVVHPTSEVTGEMIRDIYGGDVRLIRHDHRCSRQGHEHV
jgi:zinc transport system ATP-binding protein